MKTHRTIIDILRKGNQELFHSSMIAWLLDPQAEHGIDDEFLKGFGHLVAERGCGSMSAALRTTASSDDADKLRQTVQAIAGFTTNDRRFLNWYFLERFVEHLGQSKVWQSCRLKTDKNMQSGVWLALFNPSDPPNPYRFDRDVEEFCKQNSAGLWFHIELWSGLLAESDGDTAGVIQLKCHSDQKSHNAAIRDSFQAIRQLEDGESFVKSVKNDADTFYLIGRSLFRSQLTYSGLEEQLESFMRRFGSFGELARNDNDLEN